MVAASTLEKLQIRIHGAAHLPTLIYLPGLHGDWTLIGDFRKHLAGKVRFVEFTYPRTLTWSLDDYAEAIEKSLAQNGITSGWLLGESCSPPPVVRFAVWQARQLADPVDCWAK